MQYRTESGDSNQTFLHCYNVYLLFIYVLELTLIMKDGMIGTYDGVIYATVCLLRRNRESRRMAELDTCACHDLVCKVVNSSLQVRYTF
jgi:hypothetical protein